MSPDLRASLHRAAPRPVRAVDERALAQRARRITWTRRGMSLALVAALAGGAAVVASAPGERPADVVGDPRPQPDPYVRAERREGRRFPPGPRYEVASGSYGDDWNEPWRGKRWQLLVWGDRGTSCYQLAEEGAARYDGVSCSATEPLAHLGPTTAFFTGSPDPAEFYFVVGQVGPEVRRLELRGARGPDVDVPLLDPPARAGVRARYFAALLPLFDDARLVALGGDGATLESDRICGPGCQEERAAAVAAEKAAALARYEAAPVTIEAAAATYANVALAQAGLIDQFGTFWMYRGIDPTGGDFVAKFTAARCTGASDVGYTCGGNRDRAWARVGIRENVFVVEDAEGPMTDAQRETLLSYSDRVVTEVREWRLVSYELDPRSGDEWDVAFVMVWTGNVGAPRHYGSECTLTLRDAEGDVVYRSQPLPYFVGPEEQHRMVHTLTGARPAGTPEDLTAECDDPRPGLSRRP